MRLFIVPTILFLTIFSYAENLIKKTGTFTSLYYHEEAGDLLGSEIRIVFTRDGYQGTFQVAEGGPSNLIVLRRVIIQGNTIKFSVTDSLYEGDFIGEISRTGLTGTLTLKNGNKIPLELKRGKSYWD